MEEADDDPASGDLREDKSDSTVDAKANSKARNMKKTCLGNDSDEDDDAARVRQKRREEEERKARQLAAEKAEKKRSEQEEKKKELARIIAAKKRFEEEKKALAEQKQREERQRKMKEEFDKKMEEENKHIEEERRKLLEEENKRALNKLVAEFKERKAEAESTLKEATSKWKKENDLHEADIKMREANAKKRKQDLATFTVAQNKKTPTLALEESEAEERAVQAQSKRVAHEKEMQKNIENAVKSLSVGDKVVIHGMATGSPLEGQSGTLEVFKGGRWGVKLENGNQKLLKPVNLKKSDAGATTEAESGKKPDEVLADLKAQEADAQKKAKEAQNKMIEIKFEVLKLAQKYADEEAVEKEASLKSKKIVTELLAAKTEAQKLVAMLEKGLKAVDAAGSVEASVKKAKEFKLELDPPAPAVDAEAPSAPLEESKADDDEKEPAVIFAAQRQEKASDLALYFAAANKSAFRAPVTTGSIEEKPAKENEAESNVKDSDDEADEPDDAVQESLQEQPVSPQKKKRKKKEADAGSAQLDQEAVEAFQQMFGQAAEASQIMAGVMEGMVATSMAWQMSKMWQWSQQ
eukprot:gnl/MRDRNA2_/MRDRNA2_31175_c0_seq1.p1 gnl/MRDRNA2_/MRDRNA2_31175_c0~~gnl/MRDRNA2_/MRDRNA2_31175_c0_seq1.p1  ORF type:complete len:655 (-),score=253.19 gnl/MRDRNA2_/MRDRNA2_31175_c0_seq1:71-1813(-)